MKLVSHFCSWRRGPGSSFFLGPVSVLRILAVVISLWYVIGACGTVVDTGVFSAGGSGVSTPEDVDVRSGGGGEEPGKFRPRRRPFMAGEPEANASEEHALALARALFNLRTAQELELAKERYGKEALDALMELVFAADVVPKMKFPHHLKVSVINFQNAPQSDAEMLHFRFFLANCLQLGALGAVEAALRFFFRSSAEEKQHHMLVGYRSAEGRMTLPAELLAEGAVFFSSFVACSESCSFMAVVDVQYLSTIFSCRMNDVSV